MTWNSKHPVFKWMFQLDDSKPLHGKLVFHQTSTQNWLFTGFQACHHSGQFYNANFLGRIWNLHPLELVFKKLMVFTKRFAKIVFQDQLFCENISFDATDSSLDPCKISEMCALFLPVTVTLSNEGHFLDLLSAGSTKGIWTTRMSQQLSKLLVNGL